MTGQPRQKVNQAALAHLTHTVPGVGTAHYIPADGEFARHPRIVTHDQHNNRTHVFPIAPNTDEDSFHRIARAAILRYYSDDQAERAP